MEELTLQYHRGTPCRSPREAACRTFSELFTNLYSGNGASLLFASIATTRCCKPLTSIACVQKLLHPTIVGNHHHSSYKSGGVISFAAKTDGRLPSVRRPSKIARLIHLRNADTIQRRLTKA